MKTLNNLKNLLLLILVLAAASCTPEDGVDGADGTDGQQGAVGQDGNANVATYEFTIDRNDWGPNLHYGAGNVYRAFEVNSVFIEVDFVNSYSNGDVILSYVRADGTGYGELKPTPFMASFQRPDASTYGVRIEYSPTRGDLNIATTTNGFDFNSIALDDVPTETDVRMIIIEASTFSSRSQARSFEQLCAEHGVDINNYNEVVAFAKSL